MKIDRVYTRKGDGGMTRLASGERLAKHAPRVQAYGGVDELNTIIGFARRVATPPIGGQLASIQNDLFDVGADLATSGDLNRGLRVQAVQVKRLETWIDGLNADLPALTSFVLPAGSELAVRLHMARTVCRRAERTAAELAADGDEVNPVALQYLNRLSDLLFVAARVANLAEGDVLWRPHGELGA